MNRADALVWRTDAGLRIELGSRVCLYLLAEAHGDSRQWWWLGAARR